MQPTEVLIRPAVLRDLDSLVRFQRGVVDAERPFDATLRHGDIRYYDIERLIDVENARFLIAQAAEKIVGCGFARIEAAKGYLKHAEHAYLGLMFVEPAHRGLGINGKIIEELKVWCRHRQVRELRLEVYRGNAAALNAYAKAGFIEHMVEMRMALVDPTDLER
jgi:GNAT superfamily N-acetyltransferase